MARFPLVAHSNTREKMEQKEPGPGGSEYPQPLQTTLKSSSEAILQLNLKKRATRSPVASGKRVLPTPRALGRGP